MRGVLIIQFWSCQNSLGSSQEVYAINDESILQVLKILRIQVLLFFLCLDSLVGGSHLKNMRESYHKLYIVLRPHNNISRKIIFSPHQPINFQPPFCWRTQEVYKKNESVLSIQILRSLLSSYSKILERIL